LGLFFENFLEKLVQLNGIKENLMILQAAESMLGIIAALVLFFIRKGRSLSSQV
jgi:hypothetical protein